MDGKLRLTLVYTDVSMKMSWKRTSMPGGLMPTLQFSKANEAQTGQLTGVLFMQFTQLKKTLLGDAVCCLQRMCCYRESYRSMRALILLNKPSASWSSVAKACLTMS